MHLLSKIIAYGVLATFLVIMVVVTTFAYTRGYSGVTGLDMAKVQKMRTETAQRTTR